MRQCVESYSVLRLNSGDQWGNPCRRVLQARPRRAVSGRFRTKSASSTSLRKTHGLYVLEQVLDGQPLDFCFLFSSLSSILGGLGFVAYAAANGFMDAYAHKCYHARSLPWTSANWDGWRFNKSVGANAGPGASLMELAITPAEGIQAFDRALTVAPQVLISTSPLQPRSNNGSS